LRDSKQILLKDKDQQDYTHRVTRTGDELYLVDHQRIEDFYYVGLDTVENAEKVFGGRGSQWGGSDDYCTAKSSIWAGGSSVNLGNGSRQ